MPERVHCEGIVLKTIPYRDHDLLVDLMTETRGRVTGIGRYATRSKKRFGPLLSPPNILHLQFKEAPVDSLVFLDEVSLVSPLHHLYQDLDRMAVAFYLLDCLRTVVHGPDASLYRLLKSGLLALQDGVAPREFVPHFQYQLLQVLGFQPHLEGCSRCGQRQEERYFFVFREGSLVCLRCLPEQQPFAILTTAAVDLIKQWEEGTNPGGANPGGATPPNLLGLKEASEFLPRFLEYQLGRRLRSSLILGQILDKG